MIVQQYLTGVSQFKASGGNPCQYLRVEAMLQNLNAALQRFLAVAGGDRNARLVNDGPGCLPRR